MKVCLIALFCMTLSACATTNDIENQRQDIRALAREISEVKMSALDRDGFTMGQLDRIDQAVKRMQDELSGPWDREECENYKPEAQKLFCHHKVMVADKTFDDMLESVTLQVDADFCRRATKEFPQWNSMRIAFCVEKK